MAHFWSESLIFDLIYWEMDKNPEEQEKNIFSNRQLDLFRWTLSSVLAQPSKKKKKKTTLIFFAVLPNFWQQNSKHLVTRNILVATHDSRKTVTSREWYWYQVRLWMAVQTYLAPLWFMKNTIQKTVQSRGFKGWSW